MRGLILGIVMMAMPAYPMAQQRDRAERSAAPRTAAPRDEAPQAAPARQSEHRAEPRSETRTHTQHHERSTDAASSPAPAASRNSPALPGRSSWVRPPSRDGRLPYDRDRPHYRRPGNGANVVYVPYATPVFVEREVIVEREVAGEPAAAPMMVEPPLPARLILDVHPPTAQIYADGYYIGLPEDFRLEDGGAVLEPGPHRIDIVDGNYQTVTFDVNLARGQSATFRQRLTPIRREPQSETVKAPAVPKQPSTFYLIPGCYMGNVPPKDANLPATCDIARAVSVQY